MGGKGEADDRDESAIHHHHHHHRRDRDRHHSSPILIHHQASSSIIMHQHPSSTIIMQRPTLTKDAVIKYITKCMTKSGQGSLVKVMEHSFSLCIEKAREQMQGTGSAIAKRFNLQSLTEVKSQLETMTEAWSKSENLKFGNETVRIPYNFRIAKKRTFLITKTIFV